MVAEGREWQVENEVAAQNGEAAMGLMDRVKEQAAIAAQRATQMTQEAAQQGRAKMDQAQAKRRADAMFRDLGKPERAGRRPKHPPSPSISFTPPAAQPAWTYTAIMRTVAERGA